MAGCWEEGSIFTGFIKGGNFLTICPQVVNWSKRLACVPVRDESVKMFPVFL